MKPNRRKFIPQNWSNPARTAEPWLREDSRAREIAYRKYMAEICAAAGVTKDRQMVLWPEAA